MKKLNLLYVLVFIFSAPLMVSANRNPTGGVATAAAGGAPSSCVPHQQSIKMQCSMNPALANAMKDSNMIEKMTQRLGTRKGVNGSTAATETGQAKIAEAMAQCEAMAKSCLDACNKHGKRGNDEIKKGNELKAKAQASKPKNGWLEMKGKIEVQKGERKVKEAQITIASCKKEAAETAAKNGAANSSLDGIMKTLAAAGQALMSGGEESAPSLPDLQTAETDICDNEFATGGLNTGAHCRSLPEIAPKPNNADSAVFTLDGSQLVASNGLFLSSVDDESSVVVVKSLVVVVTKKRDGAIFKGPLLAAETPLIRLRVEISGAAWKHGCC